MYGAGTKLTITCLWEGLSTPHIFKCWEVIGKGWQIHHITQHMTSFVQKILFESDRRIYPIKQFTLLLKLQWPIGVYEETFAVNIKIAQTFQNSWNFIVGKSSLQWLSRRFHDLIWRPGDMVQNLDFPRLFSRVDCTVCWLFQKLGNNSPLQQSLRRVSALQLNANPVPSTTLKLWEIRRVSNDFTFKWPRTIFHFMATSFSTKFVLKEVAMKWN